MGFGNNVKGDDFVIENYGNRFKNIKNIVSFDKIKVNAFVELIRELSNKDLILFLSASIPFMQYLAKALEESDMILID